MYKLTIFPIILLLTFVVIFGTNVSAKQVKIASVKVPLENLKSPKHQPNKTPQVGSRYYKWTDNSRLDEEYENDSYREIHVQVWFPIDHKKANIKSKTRAPYFPEIEKAKPFLTNWPDADFNTVRRIKTNSILTNEISNAEKTYPVLILSPGLGGHSSFFTYYAERLASIGYVVVGVNHKYDSNYIINRDGKVIYRNLGFHDNLKKLKIPEDISSDEYRKRRGERVAVLGKDLVFCLNQLQAVNALDFDARLRLDKVGVFGHSIGGGAAVEASKLDSRFVATLNIDGSPSHWALNTGMNQPLMYIEDLKDTNNRGNKIQYDRRNSFCKKVKGGCYRVMLNNTNHNSFLDWGFHDATTSEEKTRFVKILNTTLKYIGMFFDKHLRMKPVRITKVETRDLTLVKISPSESPEKINPVKSKQVKFRNKEVILSGTLYLPDSSAKIPAIVVY